MSLDGLPQQFEAFVDRARAALSGEITAAKTVVVAANAQKRSAENALADVETRCKQAKAQLDAVLSDLDRGSTLAGINSEIKKARTELKRVKSETEQATAALEKLAKERTEAEAKLVALGNEAQRMINIRTEGEAVMANLRAQLAQVQIGQRP